MESTQQQIAFYIHTIDLYTNNIETQNISHAVYVATGTRTPDEFMNTAREGLKNLISDLPPDVLAPVQEYINDRLNMIQYADMDTVLASISLPELTNYSDSDSQEDPDYCPETETESEDSDYYDTETGSETSESEDSDYYDTETGSETNESEEAVERSFETSISPIQTVLHFLIGYMTGLFIVRILNHFNITDPLM